MLKEAETKSRAEIQREKATARMFEAIERLDYEAVKAAIAEGADVNAWNYCKQTPLHEMLSQADGWSSRGLLQLLFEKGADPYEVDDDGDTVLHHAAMYFRKNDIPCILEYGGSSLKRVREGNRETAYETAKSWGECALEKFKTKASAPRKLRLVTLDVDINEIIDPMTGWTSLHKAAAICDPLDIEFLLEKGADPTIKDNAGRTPYELAERTINEVLELLKPEPLPWLKKG